MYAREMKSRKQKLGSMGIKTENVTELKMVKIEWTVSL
jgi:hypothetical protein